MIIQPAKRMGLKNYFFVSRDKVTELLDMMGAGILIATLLNMHDSLICELAIKRS